MSRIFNEEKDAKTACDAANSAPLKEGQERRTPSKVYVIKSATKTKYVVAQSPSAAVGLVFDEFGITCEMVGGDKLPTADDVLTRFSPEALAYIKAKLNGQA